MCKLKDNSISIDVSNETLPECVQNVFNCINGTGESVSCATHTANIAC